MPTPASPPATPTGPAPTTRRASDVHRGDVSVIAQGTRVEGRVSGEGSLEVAGRVEGSVSVKGLCHIGPDGSVAGDVKAATVVVEGRLEGRTLVADKVELGARARVRAELHARLVAVAEGAVLDGQVFMGEGEPATPIRFKEKRKDRAAGDARPASPQPPTPAGGAAVKVPEAAPAAVPEPPVAAGPPPAPAGEPPGPALEPAEPEKS